MSEQTTKPSLATGSPLTPETFADFVERLRYHCEGEGVRDHITADALFIIQARRLVIGLDTDYSHKTCAVDSENESTYFSPLEWWEDLDEEERSELDIECATEDEPQFLDMPDHDQWQLIKKKGLTVTGWDERWEYVCAHLTKEAAEAFIRRKQHDYRAGLRVYAEAQVYCWEFNAIKKALLDGKLVLAQEAEQCTTSHT